MTVSLAVRSVRAGVFAVSCVLLAAAGHALATGTVPAVWVQVAAVVPVFAAGCLLGGRERSLAGIGSAMGAVQGGLHFVFHSAQPHRAAMVMHGMPMTHGHAHAMTPHATAAHAGAALVLTWWLRRGEAAVWSLLRWAVALVPGLVAWWQVVAGARAGSDPPESGCPVDEGSGVLKGARLRYAVRRRGPPSGAAYAS
ncbi:hypothetical protein [Streptomyces sviceus]|uniref:hypothetical protein n=1 Tax=Streptomyces sviceus TaxID=285530 RepID=UPI0036E36C41